MADKFVAKPRPTGQEMEAAMGASLAHLPRLGGDTPAKEKSKAEPTVQVNFRCSQKLATTLNRLAEKEGSLRRVIARMTKNDGHTVPEADLESLLPKRRFFDEG